MKIFVFILGLFLSVNSLAEINTATDAQSHYQMGLKAFQEGQLTQAQESFRKAFEFDSKNKFILYNWGLTEYQLEQKGMAVGAWRRALFIDPDFKPVQKALKFARRQFQNSAFTNNLSSWENFHNGVLIHVTMDKLLLTSLILFLLSGALLLRYLGQRKKAFRNDTSLPPFPTVGTLFLLGLLVSTVLSFTKAYDNLITRATIIERNVTVRTGPSLEDNSLFEVLEGFEVIVRQSKNGWAQVTYPGGLTGWVPQESLFYTSGRDLW